MSLECCRTDIPARRRQVVFVVVVVVVVVVVGYQAYRVVDGSFVRA
jgi:Tfp pilus assembly protein PilO